MKRNKIIFLLGLLFMASIFWSIQLRAQTTVDINFEIKDAYWGTYQSRTQPKPGDENVPLTLIIQQKSGYYLRSVSGDVYLPTGFTDPKDDDNITTGDGVAIHTDNDAQDIIPYGTFYITVYVNIDKNVSKGTYTMQINLTYYAYNSTNNAYYVGTPKVYNFTVTIANQPPEVKSQSPSSSTVTIYVGDNQTFKIDADDPDNDSITYKWTLDDKEIQSGPDKKNFTYIANRTNKGTHTLKVDISDGEDTTTVTWTIRVPNRAPDIKDYTPSDNSIAIYAGDNRTFNVTAEDPDGDNITYTWYLDGDKVLSGRNATSYTYVTNNSDVGGHTLYVDVSDGNDSSRVTWDITVDVPSRTKIHPSQDYVYAGQKINVTVNITNNIWQGTVDIDVSYPNYVAFFSDTHWTFRNVIPGQTITMVFEMYVPAEVLTSFGEVQLIGQTMSLTLDISFTDEYGRSNQESHDVEFIIRGNIKMMMFGEKVEPNNVTVGETATASVTLINVGVATAKYANATVIPNPYISLTAESFYYIGDIDPGSPIPVVVKFRVKNNVTPGVYSVTIRIFYYDDVYNEHFMYVTLSFAVHEKPKQQSQEEQPIWKNYSLVLYAVGVVLALIVFILIAKKRIKVG